MSNALAIAAVTETIKHLLDTRINAVISGTTVTSKPLDKAREGITGNQVNLFLYQTLPNAAWRNMDLPRQVKPGETGYPPLSLNLFYLITAYAQGDEDGQSHQLLGMAMSVLHDHPLLDGAEIHAALPQSDLDQQIERVRITPQPFSLEEMSKLWTAFQTQYRISAGYQVAVVLIDSALPTRAPLPVLRRGDEDRGAVVTPATSPTLSEVRPPVPLPSARLGDDLTLVGQHLDGEGITARFSNPRLTDSISRDPLPGGTDTQLSVHLPSTSEDPAALADWTPGLFSLALVVNRTGLPKWTSNELPLALAPVITVAPTNAAAGDITLTLTCSPRLRDGQRILLLFGDRQIQPQSITTPVDTTQPSSLAFLIPGVSAGAYTVRLRVDGVDSLPFVRTGTPPRLEFDPNQKVTVA